MSLHGILATIEWAKRHRASHGWVETDRRRKPYRTEQNRPRSPRPDEIERLILTGEMRDMTCVAKIVGVSRERVRQVVKERGIDRTLLKRNSTMAIEWPCPRCGGSVKTTTRSIELGAKSTVFCRKCAHSGDNRKLRTNRYCSVVNCDKPHAAKGYCQPHYYRKKNGLLMEPPIGHRSFTRYGCEAVDCEETHHAKGYCRSHYNQLCTREKGGIETDLPLGSYLRIAND